MKNNQYAKQIHLVDDKRVFENPGASAVTSHRKKPSLLHSSVTALDRWLTRKMIEVVGSPPVRISLWDGIEVTPPCENPIAVMRYYDRGALLKTIADPELHWGDLYCTGRVEFAGDMAEFMEVIYRGISGRGKGSQLRQLVLWLGHRRIFNTQDKAKDNIYHHYDIGNEYYKLWLDREEMQYTCAYFPREDMTLEEGQRAKLHHICRKLQLSPGEHVVEAGCGWGGLARFMARNYEIKVTAYNISKEQVKYARQQAEDEGLSHLVEYVLDDYRNIRGKYDAFVSVGMLEHVGIRDYQELGQVIKRSLKPQGRGLIHSIGRQEKGPMNAWIERRIFPGARPPALSELMDIFEPNQMAALDIENIRLHYSRTLQMWTERFEKNEHVIKEMMDDEFYKAWSLYLHGSMAAFNVGELQLYQVVFSHMGNMDIPWSRQYIYDAPTSHLHSNVKLSVVPGEAE